MRHDLNKIINQKVPTIDVDKLSDRNYTSTYRRLTNIFGIDHVSASLGIPVEQVKSETRLELPKLINHSFQRINCPNCDKFILTPYATFEKEFSRKKTMSMWCIWCNTPLTVHIEPGIPIIVTKENEVNELKFSIQGMPGCSLTTPVCFRYSGDNRIEMKVGFAMGGNVNFKQMIRCCPFDPNFHDNFIQVFGSNLGECMDKLKAEIKCLIESILH